MLKRCAAWALSLALLTALGSSALAVEFPDVAAEHWAYEEIQYAHAAGLMQGIPSGEFRPNENLDRASFLAVLSRMFAWPVNPPAAPTFSDVPTTHWAYGIIEAAVAQGVVTPAELFSPSGYISRQDMAVYLVRALGYETLAQDLVKKGWASSFADVKEYPGHIALAAAFGLTNGIPNGDGTLSFQPQSFATRDQAAAMLARVHRRYVSKVDWLHAFYAFSSYSQLSLTDAMDGVSLGWARLEVTPEGASVNQTASNGNDMILPQGSELVTSHLAGQGVGYHLDVYADTTANVPLPDGTATSALELLLSRPDLRDQAVAALVEAGGAYPGLTIDFEGLKTTTYRAAFVDFMTALRRALPADKGLYVCVPPDLWYQGYDYRALGELCDKVILMAHDYQWFSVPEDYVGTRAPDSPVTPLPSIYHALASITDPETGVADRSKIALAISFSSAGFAVDEKGVLQSTEIFHPTPEIIAQRMGQADTVITYDVSAQNPVMDYTVTTAAEPTEDDPAPEAVTQRYRLWYEDARSVTAKLDLARMFGVTGVSIWRLGRVPAYEGLPDYNVWSAFLAQR